MPVISEAQRGAMYAAKAGKSTLGIPKKVGEEFVKADPGGKLPEHASSKMAKGFVPKDKRKGGAKDGDKKSEGKSRGSILYTKGK